MSTVGAPLFDEVVAATGLSPAIAPFTVTRLLLRAGVGGEESLTPDRLEAALPQLESGLRLYLAEDEVARSMERLRALASAG